jgi:AraC-like DNA-binding protein
MRTPGRVDYYSLAIPLSGHQVSMTDAGEVTTRSPQARVHSAGSVYDITRSANYVAIIVGLSVAGFERFVGDKIDVLIGPDSSFSLVLDLTDKRFNLFTSILGTLLKALGERVDDSPQSDIVITRLEDALWFSFADACPELYREYREIRRPSPKSGAVNRVTAYIHDNVERELTLSELVRVSGMSARTLHSGFRDAYGTGPMAYVKRLRLNRCRKELLAAGAEEGLVGDIAASWGFYHLSSFARYYREEFGELPSESLKRGGHAFRRGAHHKS